MPARASGRFMIQDMLGHVYQPLGNTEYLPANVLGTGAVRGAVGLLPLPGRGRSARRHQHAVAAVRRGQPDAGRHRAAAVHQHAGEDEARALRVGHAGADRVAADHHADRRRAEDLQRRPGDRLPRAGAQVQRRRRAGHGARARQVDRGDAARGVQQLSRRGGVRILRRCWWWRCASSRPRSACRRCGRPTRPRRRFRR